MPLPAPDNSMCHVGHNKNRKVFSEVIMMYRFMRKYTYMPSVIVIVAINIFTVHNFSLVESFVVFR